MIRLSSLFWLALVLISGFAMFKVKYAVQDRDDALVRTRKQTVAEQQEIRVLNAEWSYLTQPERLAELNRKFLSLAPIPTKQLQHSIDDIPLRPPPPPALPADPVAVAATTPEAAAPAGAQTDAASAVPQPAASATSLDQLIAAAIAPANAAEPVAVAPAVLPTAERRPVPAKVATLKSETPVRLAKTAAGGHPHTLDQLFAEIDGGR